MPFHQSDRRGQFLFVSACLLLTACNPAALGGTLALVGGGGGGGGGTVPPDVVTGTLDLLGESVAPGSDLRVRLTFEGTKAREVTFEADVDDLDSGEPATPLAADRTQFPTGDTYEVSLTTPASLATDSYWIRCRFGGSASGSKIASATRLVITNAVPADPVDWTKIGGASQQVQLAGAARTPAGDLAVCGFWDGDLQLPGMASPVRDQGAVGFFVGIVNSGAVAQSAAGEFAAHVAIGSDNDDVRALGVTVLGDESIVVCGTFQGQNCQFGLDTQGGSVNRNSRLTNSGGNQVSSFDAFVARYVKNPNDQTLRVVWLTTFSGEGTIVASTVDVVEGSPERIAVGGGFSGSAQFGTTVLTARGASDGFVGMLDTSGSPIWTRAIGGPTTDNEGVTCVSGASVTVNGVTTSRLAVAATVSGASTDDIQIRSDTQTLRTLTSAGSLDGALMSFRTTGDLLFATRCGGPESDRTTRLFHAQGSGSIYLLGKFGGTASFEGGQAISLTATGPDAGRSGFLIKYDQAGGVRWGHRLDCPDFISVDDVTLFADPVSVVAISGSFRGSFNLGFDVSVGRDAPSASAARARLRSTADQDAFVARFTVGTGQLESARVFAGPGDQAATGLVALPDYTAYMIGVFRNALAVPGGQTFVPRSTEAMGTFFMRTSHSGN